ncbi:MAG: helix-turn-helix domain-containing protein [Muricomes sp.]
MEITERIKQIREDTGLSQEAFGEKMGVSRGVIMNIEYGRISEVKEYVIRAICREYKVSYFWLKDGMGEPYIGVPDIILDEAVEKYELDDSDRGLIEGYVKLDPKIRDAIKAYLSEALAKEKTPE